MMGAEAVIVDEDIAFCLSFFGLKSQWIEGSYLRLLR